MMFKDKYIHKLYAFALAALFALTLAGCGGGGTAAAPDPEPPPMPPTAYEVAVAAIAAAETEEAARAAVTTAVAAGISGTELQDLNTKVDARVEALALMGRIDAQKMAMMNAAGMIDTSDLSTQAAVDAAEAAIAALKRAIAAAVDVDDTSMYDTQVTTAESAVETAQSALDHAAQTMALMNAVDDLQAIDLTDLSTKEKIDAAQGAIDALQTALDNATELSAAEKTAAMTELGTANRTVMTAQGRYDTAAQRKALADAVATLAALDLDNLMTQAQIDAAVAAITGVNLALEGATNLTDAEKLDATVDVTVAQRKVDRAETTLAGNVDQQRTTLREAGSALADIDLDDLDTAEKITAANNAVNALKAALDGATHLSDSEKAPFQTQLNAATETVRMAETGMDRAGRMTAQRTAITNAVAMARAAVAAVSDDSTDSEVAAADTAIAALKKAIDDAVDLPDGDTDVASARGTLATLEPQLASAKTSRTAAIAAKQKEADADAMADAKKLYDGINTPTGDGSGADDYFAGYNTTDNADIDVTFGDGTNAGTAVTLSEDEDATVADNHGWTGQKFTASGTDVDGTYEAYVYSHVGEPTQGDKFGHATVTDGYEYTLNASGELATLTAPNVASSSFDHTAGTKEFERGNNLQRVSIPGTYHGVSGTYYCTPAADSTCAAQVAASGFTLGGTADSDNAFTAGGGTWTFKPTDPETRIMSTPDGSYASYGWWLHKSADGDTFTASAFVARRGDADAASGINDLNGKATYMGGAAGKYALYSATGGTNDAGHFTARATLEANFTTNTTETAITGTIDNFIGADGQSRNWSVKLNGSQIGDAGEIGNASASTGADTTWTIDGTAADDSGDWTGSLQENGDDGVPAIGTGTFYTEYGTAGKMVGAFGVNKQ